MVVKRTRFAAIVRVSTDKQEKQGESLRNQKAQIENAVREMGGEIVKWYVGQEHATEGYERRKLEELLADAQAKTKIFDAVIVVDATRWSRHNDQSTNGLNILRQNGIRFFLLTQEQDLFDPSMVMCLGMFAVMGEYQAKQQKLKSAQNCIERAKRLGAPTAGKKPYGRVWNKVAKVWGVDPEKKAKIEDIATRYLEGESLPKLAIEHGLNHSFLAKTLRESCGDSYSITWDIPDLNLFETVEIRIPRLLPDETIKAIRQLASRNQTYKRGDAKNLYLLGGHVFCGCCGYALTGGANSKGLLYYRHRTRNRSHLCDFLPAPYVRADELEKAIVEELYQTFGNPVAVERAIREAIPNQEQINSDKDRLAKLREELAKLQTGRDRVLKMIASNKVTEQQAEKQLDEINQMEGSWAQEIARIEENIAWLPTDGDVDQAKRMAKRLAKKSVSRYWRAIKKHAGEWENATREDMRQLVKATFDGIDADGKPLGVYVFPIAEQQSHRRKEWAFRVKAKIPGFSSLKSASYSFNPIDGFESVTRCASGSPRPSPLARRWRRPLLQHRGELK